MSTSASSSCCSVTRGQGRPARYAPRRPHSFAAATRLAPHAQLAAAASSSGRALAPAALRRASGVTHSAPADASTTAAGGGGEGGREAWFQKKSEYVTDLKSRAEVEAFAKNGSKYTVLDLYAGESALSKRVLI